MAALVANAARAALAPTAISLDTSAVRKGSLGLSLTRELAAADSVVRARGGAHAETAQLFLTWNAPYGLKRATTMRTPHCGDPSAGDTLYLSFLPGRASDGFSGFTATLTIHPAPGDSLGAFWRFEKGGANAGELVAEFDQVAAFPGRRPYRTPGQGFVKLDHANGAAQLRMIYAVPHGGLAPIAADSLYALARIVLHHRHSAAGCEQPVCIEWVSATLGYALKDEPDVARGERLVGYGPRGSDPTAPFHAPAPRAWRPKAATH